MFAVCKGLHCAGCKPQFSIPPGVIVVILCLIYRHTIGVILETLIIGAALTFIATGVLMAILYPILMRVLMPRTMYMSPAAVASLEAQYNGREVANGKRATRRQAIIPDTRRPVVDVSYSVEVLPRKAYEWQDQGQQQLSSRRYPNNSRAR